MFCGREKVRDLRHGTSLAPLLGLVCTTSTDKVYTDGNVGQVSVDPVEGSTVEVGLQTGCGPCPPK